MFSGLRNVMENLAQPQPRPGRPGHSESQDFSPERFENQGRASASFDLTSVAQSTGHLAESAFSNLRKSLAAQRPFVVSSPLADTYGNGTPDHDRELRPVTKSTLEDRLRASFAIGDASGATTPDPSLAPSPRPTLSAAPDRVLSPKSMPLPDSPTSSPRQEVDLVSPQPIMPSEPISEDHSQPEISLEDHPPSESTSEDHPLAEESVTENVEKEQSLVPEKTGTMMRIDISPVIPRYPEADVPLPLFSPAPTNLAASQSSHSQSENTTQIDNEANSLRAELSSLEKMHFDVTKTLEVLKAGEDAVNAVLVELTPVTHISDVKGLKEHLQKLNANKNLSEEEINRLSNRLRTYDDRIEELRDTHRLESRSQTELVDSLRKQLEESEALLNAAHASATHAEELMNKRQAELDQARAGSQKLKDSVKEEEEKRVKAISLLKTVRQKLVKAEKERDDAFMEISALKEKDKVDRESEKVERARIEKEIEKVRSEKEKDVTGLKAHFDRELVGMKERLEKDFTARKFELENEAMSTKAAYQREVSAKNGKIQVLENSVRSLNSERDSLFDQLQMRQAELESSQSLLESLQSNTSELQFQLREATDRSALLVEELADARRELEYRDLRPSESSEDSSCVRAALEAKYETKINELSIRLTEAERDWNEAEAALSRTLLQKSQEIESLRRLADTSVYSKGITEEEVIKLEHEIEALRHQITTYKEQLSDLDRQKDLVSELEAQLFKQTEIFSTRTEQYKREVADAKEREAHIRASNKTLREELRKVQSSAALLERQRNPGVGYWGTVSRHDNSSEARLSSPSPSTSDLAILSRTGSPAPANNDEELNLEYLRNVILQFLEHKDMRPHLVRVLSIILHFTPQETRRLIAKV